MKRNSKHLKTLRDRGFGRAAIRCTDPRPVHLAQGVTRFALVNLWSVRKRLLQAMTGEVRPEFVG
jgi:hypothetical protein